MPTTTPARRRFRSGIIAAIVLATATTTTLATAPAHAANTLTMLGADVSSLQRSQDLGARYADSTGKAADPIDLMKSAGMNTARLRIWNNPASGYNGEATVLKQARYLSGKGMKLLIDFHYSDTWADPGKQTPPKAWAGHTLAQLQKDVYDYTYRGCTDLKAQGTAPAAVQIGNEINTGMLWPVGEVENNDFGPLASLLNAGYNATKACNPSTQVVVHTADAGSDAAARWFYDGITAAGAKWDITGLSYYCQLHGSLSNLYNVITDMRTRYSKPVLIAETAYPFTDGDADSEKNSITGTCDDQPLSWQGQATSFSWVQNTARNAGAMGVLYWEPTWYAVKGNGWDPSNITGTGDGWDNEALFDWQGRFNPDVRWTP
jgi:arabinogalactan endo-1,4-beta-galactosidase